jgi:hypothetical protein
MRDPLPSGDGKNDKSTTRNKKKADGFKASPLRVPSYNYFCHLTNAREPAGKEGGAWVWLSRCGWPPASEKEAKGEKWKPPAI